MRLDRPATQPVQNPPVEREDIAFGHPSEGEFAQILDFYGIEWQYEPVTFPLAWDDQGNVTEAFSPDFYLVDQDMYVELTTLRSRLLRVKRHKARRLKELYPDIHVRLWRRRDFEYLLQRFGQQDRHDSLVGQDALSSQHE